MKSNENLVYINSQIDQIIEKALSLEEKYNELLLKAHPIHRESALNLIHYLAFRNFDIDNLQYKLLAMGLPDLANIEGHVM